MKNNILILFGVLLLFSSCYDTVATYKIGIFNNDDRTQKCYYLVDTIIQKEGGKYWFKYISRTCENMSNTNTETKDWVTNCSNTTLYIEKLAPVLEQKHEQERDQHKLIIATLVALGTAIVIFSSIMIVKR